MSVLYPEIPHCGDRQVKRQELTAKQINEDGGILGREVQVIGLDGKGAPDDSVTAYQEARRGRGRMPLS